ncbi:outer membrane receptor protein involved in Fe transport [Paucibacter oligotrophus]|uniref:Outer membrane receptor protein involved in Fe transport n=1 Tax=Roseateles oligotrophus TaxID=1769250 RepID=A0A840L5D8_9BURK|nr:TonB-dependent receptor [Roseateles oligotrophus]MBB4841755.1 outer membrane receptor protein involved in Fe transport [Roseateles oligotrophus]
MYSPSSQPLPPAWLAAALSLLCAGTARAEPTQLPRVEVISSSPLRGSALAREQMPGLVQSLGAADLQRRQALDLPDYLARNLASVSLNEAQGNPLQADLNYRGFSASPLLGTPQGLSVYLDGVRLNQPFGDVVSWDLIPSSAIEQAVLMPGSNPLFGLNTLGGALALQTKTGLSSPGSALQLSGGSHRRVLLEFESGGGSPQRHWFVTAKRLHEQGWRAASPSDQSQLFAKLGGRVGAAELRLALALAGNELSGNGLQEQGALARDWRSIYTAPDTTRNRAQLLNLELNQGLAGGMRLSGNLFYRRISTDTLNGDINEEALGQSVYQPNAEEREALAAAGYSGYPAAGANAANTPFPRWRCIANVLLNEEPNEKCNGLLNRTHSLQQHAGLGAQLAGESQWAGLKSQWLLGAALDWSRVDFQQSTQFGFINPDRTVSGLEGPGAFADGSQNSEDAFDARVDLRSRGHTASLFASSALSLSPATLLTLSGRYNRAAISNRDQIRPGGGTGSLDGEHVFSHFNPGLGLTHALSPALQLYASASQGARAPTSVELGCADPASPCKLPNAMAGDPPLRQVITHSWELGARGRWAGLDWHLGAFRADNHDDLLFVADNSSGFGYFRNFGLTRRQGLEASLQWQAHRDLRLGANLSLLDATYQSAEQVGGTGNSSNESAQAGLPGLEGVIQIRPGDRIPLLPRQQLKLTLDWRVSPQWNLGLDLQASAGATARGNENGQHRPDGVFYTGPGRSAGYALLNLGLDYRPAHSGLKFFVQIKNLFDTRYSTAAQLGANAFDAQGNYRARPLPANANGDYPLIHATFFAPGAPRAAWLGLRYEFAE